MAFKIGWDDAEKTLFRYTASETWNWNDFHKHMKLSEFAFDSVSHKVEAIFDASGSFRIPGGAIAHLRMLGKADHVNRTPRIVVIGIDEAIQQKMGAVDGVYKMPSQLIQFVDSEAEAQAVIAAWRAEAE